jgi:CheY-like chemotaxis protein
MPNSATVLVVEDDLSTRGLLVAVVKHLGLDAKAAGDGRVALEMIAEAAPEVIILDLIMPEVDGFEVLREIRRTAPHLLSRTIVVTAAAIRNIGERPDLDLIWRFLRKPLDIDQLGASVLGCLSQGSNKAGRDGAYKTPPRP